MKKWLHTLEIFFREKTLKSFIKIKFHLTQDVSEDEKLFGRNYDWYDLNSAMIIKSNPKNGYKSISTVQMDFLGFGNNFKPDTFGHKYISSAALFVPLDGMNEKGLCVSDLMAGDDEVTHQNTGKSNVTTTLAIRCMLDFCADVDEAVEFLKNHDMNSVIGKAHHFAISDASGKTVVVEYINNEMKITETNAVTNHYLAPDSGKSFEGCENSLMRFNVLEKALKENPKLSEEDVKDVLYNIRASQYESSVKTWWRAVYNQCSLSVSKESPEEEDEIIIKCSSLSEDVIQLISKLKNGNSRITLYKNNEITFVELKDILYFESVEDHVFGYTEAGVFESKQKLYQLEELLPECFLRASKAVIVNINKIEKLIPDFSGRIEANLSNGCQIIFSRMYIPVLKQHLGL